MFISKKSLSIYVLLNTFLICLSILQDYSISTTHKSFILFIFIIRNYVLLYFINVLSKHKKMISNNLADIPKEDYKYEFDVNIISSSIIETITHIIIHNNYTFKENNILFDIACFIPISFLFEIIFDLFHYSSHRALHHKFLYKYFHKKHHKFNHPSSKITFYQDPVDIITTNSIPIILTLSIIPKLSYLQLSMIIIYKTYGEICGHLGKLVYPTSSFSQFMWLPRFLNIELHSEEHDLHHSLNNCNYSKRFSIWDKIFGTFKAYHE